MSLEKIKAKFYSSCDKYIYKRGVAENEMWDWLEQRCQKSEDLETLSE